MVKIGGCDKPKKLNNPNNSFAGELTTVRAERLGIESLLKRLGVNLDIVFDDPTDRLQPAIVFQADWGGCHYQRLNTGEISIVDVAGNCGVMIDNQAQQMHVWTNDRISQTENRQLWHQFIHAGVAAYLSDRGFTPIHAAAVVAPNGDAWLIGGQTHSGKSTLVLGLIERGWQFLSDDSLILAVEAGEIVAHAWLGMSLLNPILLATYPHLRSKLGAMVGDRQLIDLQSCYPTQWRAKIRPQGLLFPAFSPTTQTAKLEPISAGMALGNLMSHAARCLMETPQPHLAHLQALVDRCQYFNLLLGPTLQTQPNLVADVLLLIPNRL